VCTPALHSDPLKTDRAALPWSVTKTLPVAISIATKRGDLPTPTKGKLLWQPEVSDALHVALLMTVTVPGWSPSLLLTT
jgi:hypothetical protein